MVRYVFLVSVLACVVDLLLILGANALAGYPPGLKRSIPAAVVGGAYAALCLAPGLSFLGNGIWRVVVIGTVSVIAFGIDHGYPRRWMIFMLLKFALHGIATAFDSSGFGSVLLVSGTMGVLYVCSLRGNELRQELIPVELNYGQRKWKLTALRDTGNTLRDPITGERVLVAGADMGEKLLGLTDAQLAAPAETLASGLAPGMRLIPYRTVGQQGAMMLAMRLRHVKVGAWQGSALVAFAPARFGTGEGYQMLVGGAMG